MKYDRTVLAYHGCDASVAERVLSGDPFRPSENDYDWLGSGIYFWKRRGKIRKPDVVGAILQLGSCFDLMDTRFTDDLPVAFEMFKRAHEQSGQLLPRNSGKTPDRKLRRLDCAIVNFYLRWLKDNQDAAYDTVRCGFVEGPPAFQGSGIRQQSHVQVAVRNPACVVGVFRPR